MAKSQGLSLQSDHSVGSKLLNPERWKKVEEVFDAVIEHSPAEREAFLSSACADDDDLRHEVETLIRSYEAAGLFIEDPIVGPSIKVNGHTDPGSSWIGRRIGSYSLVREIGRGGMGAVFLAIRADDEFQKRVAIKLVKRGMDTDFILRRFRQERQILASLDHPYIARLLDGGTTDDGLPYFVMEYIEGLPITSYCDTHKLSTIDRLKLFLKICSAVHHAHLNLVIHRDLKPSNVLVTPDGTPKLLDFGISKLLNPDMGVQTLDPTTLAMRLMTPEYASPEQVRGDSVSVASDIYSLGVVLYELLTGHRPYRFKSHTADELARVICEQEPEKPSVVINLVEMVSARNSGIIEVTPEAVARAREESLERLRRELAGSLDNVVLKALRKEPHRRYQSAEDLGEDLQRYLDGAPVLAPAFLPSARQSASDTGETSTAPKAIAVLPFKTLHGEDQSDEYLGMGMADALITKLSNIRRIIVRPTSSIIKYFEGGRSAVTAGFELDVDFVLDGRIQRTEGRVRVTVQLVRVHDGAPLWAEKFDEKFTDIFTVEDSISEQVAQALMPRLTGEEIELLHKRETDNADAYQCYLKGRYFWNKFTDEGFARALELFKEAIRLDPNYALAYVGLADYLNWAAIFGIGAPRDYFPQAKAAALKALELDSTLEEAHAALAFTILCYDWDAKAAESRFKMALDQNPNYAPAHQWYSNLLTVQGRFEEAIAEIKRAQELNPLSLMDRSITGWTYYHARNYEFAVHELELVLELDRNFGNSVMMLGTTLERLGEYDRAISTLRRALELMDGSIVPLWMLGYTLAVSGRKTEALEIITRLKRLAEQIYVSPYAVAVIYAGLDDKDAAFEWLEKAYRSRDEWLIWLGTEPKLDSLRSDPRYTSLLRRVGIWPMNRQSAEFETPARLDERLIETERIPVAGHNRGNLLETSADSLQLESVQVPVALQIGNAFIKSSATIRRMVRKKRTWPWFALAGLLVLILLGLGITLLNRPTEHYSRFDKISTTKLTSNGTANSAAISPDGKFLAYSIEEGGKQSLWWRPLDITTPTRLIAPAEVEYRGFAFSKDGSYIYYVAQEKEGRANLFRIASFGGISNKIIDNVDSPVGLSQVRRQFAFVRNNPEREEDVLIVCNEDGSNPVQLASRRFPRHFSISSAPSWSPDSQMISVVEEAADERGFFMSIAMLDLENKIESSFGNHRWNQIGQTSWLDDKTGLLFSAQDERASFRQLILASYPNGIERRLMNDPSDYDLAGLTAGSNKIIAVQRTVLTNIWTSQKGALERTKQLTSGVGRYFDVTWSPDGRIIYASDSNGNADIWEMGPDGGDPRPLTTGVGRSYGPTVSADGRYLVFHSSRSGNWQIWRADRDGSNPIQLTSGNEDSTWARITPDGRWVIYVRSGAESPATLWKISIDGGTPVRLNSELSMRPAISPDGKSIAFWHKDQRPGAQWHIAVMPIDGGPPSKILTVPLGETNGDSVLRWSTDGSAIIFLDYRDGISTLWLLPADGSPSKKITEVVNNQIYAFDLAPDGRYVFSRGLRSNDVVLITDIHQ